MLAHTMLAKMRDEAIVDLQPEVCAELAKNVLKRIEIARAARHKKDNQQQRQPEISYYQI